MPESEVLLTIAEVAVAFAGFASLVGILGQGTSADDPRVIGVRMRGMLLSSLIVVAFSIFPILLARYGASLDVIWTASSLAVVGVNVFLPTPAVYLTALALVLFQSGFAFCLIVFSFLPRVEASGGALTNGEFSRLSYCGRPLILRWTNDTRLDLRKKCGLEHAEPREPALGIRVIRVGDDVVSFSPDSGDANR